MLCKSVTATVHVTELYNCVTTATRIAVSCSWRLWQDIMVVDQDVVDLTIVSDIYYLTFGFEARLDVTMIWGTRIELTWWDYLVDSIVAKCYS